MQCLSWHVHVLAKTWTITLSLRQEGPLKSELTDGPRGIFYQMLSGLSTPRSQELNINNAVISPQDLICMPSCGQNMSNCPILDKHVKTVGSRTSLWAQGPSGAAGPCHMNAYWLLSYLRIWTSVFKVKSKRQQSVFNFKKRDKTGCCRRQNYHPWNHCQTQSHVCNPNTIKIFYDPRDQLHTRRSTVV